VEDSGGTSEIKERGKDNEKIGEETSQEGKETREKGEETSQERFGSGIKARDGKVKEGIECED
jgi:hypothetical protein